MVDAAPAVPEERLAHRARAGDAAAYGELARRHQDGARRVALAVLGTPDGADDVVQRALERAWTSIDRFDPERPFGPWLRRIAANLARNDRRARGRRAALARRVAVASGAGTGAVGAGAGAGAGPGDRGADGDGRGLRVAGVVPTPEEIVLQDHDRGEVVRALDRLCRDDRQVITLRYLDGLSEREAAAALGCPTGTVKSRLSRAVGRLRGLLLVGVVALLVAAGALVAPVREAVAEVLRLGIGSTVVDLVPAGDADPAGLPPLRAGADPLGPEEARARLGSPVSDLGSTRLGAPDRVLGPPEGGVLVVWEEGVTTLWVRRTPPDGDVMVKQVHRQEAGRVTSIAGTPPMVQVRGEHVLTTPARRVAAGTVVLWTDRGREHRLESDLPPRTVRAIARSLP